MEDIMERVFRTLEQTMNKSSITLFRNFVNKYSDVTKWFICSDYCLDDKNKPNNVISFVIYPYIIDFNEWDSVIKSMQKTDLKNCRSISKEFCSFIKKGYFFSFNFILEKNCILEKWKDKTTMDKAIEEYIEMQEQWQKTTPKNAESYKNTEKLLRELQNQSKKKSFNYKLLGRIFEISFLASYLKYLLYREVKKIEIFSWLSDRDAITSWNHGIYKELYQIMSHCLISSTLGLDKANSAEELILSDPENYTSFDAVNRVADFICGGIADFNYVEGSVSGNKQCQLMEDAISDNDYLIILKISEKDIARVEHRKIHIKENDGME